MKNINNDYLNPYGIWEVTTEADCEGWGVHKIGIYEGYLDEIALHLADKVYYSLTLKKIVPEKIEKFTPKAKSIYVSFAYDSNFTAKNIVINASKMLRNRPCQVKNGNRCSCVKICTDQYNEEDIKRQKALDKLSPEERKILGL